MYLGWRTVDSSFREDTRLDNVVLVGPKQGERIRIDGFLVGRMNPSQSWESLTDLGCNNRTFALVIPYTRTDCSVCLIDQKQTRVSYSNQCCPHAMHS